MENCCANLCSVFKKQKEKPKILTLKTVVLKDPTGREIGLQYELGRELAKGDFGRTYLCKDRETNEELACELISKNLLITAGNIENLRREVEIMRHLPKHPNIVSLKYTYEDDDYVYLVKELCEGGSLIDFIVDSKCYTERCVAPVIKTIVEVIQMCHKHGVMHRNLNLGNILFVHKTETTTIKVTNFRWSIFFKPGERLNQIVRNLYYMAPELVKGSYGPEIDIWSAGVILCILLSGYPPFSAEFEQGIYQALIEYVIDLQFSSGIWSNFSNNAKNLVKSMLHIDPKRRLTAQEVLDHPFLIDLVMEKSNDAKDVEKGYDKAIII